MTNFLKRLFYFLVFFTMVSPACQKNALPDTPLTGHWEGQCRHVYRGSTDTVPGTVFGVVVDLNNDGSGDLLFKNWGHYPFNWITGSTFTSMRWTCGPGVDFRSTRLDPITLHVETHDGRQQRWIAPFTQLRDTSDKFWIDTEFIFEVEKQ